MAIDRRAFLKFAMALGAAAVLPAVRLAGRAWNSKTARAVRGGRYPGKVNPMDPAQVARTAKWAG